jgi:nucleotide-binding universal stress UspA family protein
MTRFCVVGVDGSRESEAALRFALEEAALRSLSLRVVCAWEASAGAYVGEAFAPTADAFVEAEHHAEDVLRAALEHISNASVLVEALTIEGHPATVLVEQARGADLLVVGSRGRGAATTLLLGSVSQSLAHHAPCPLVIVPLRDE